MNLARADGGCNAAARWMILSMHYSHNFIQDESISTLYSRCLFEETFLTTEPSNQHIAVLTTRKVFISSELINLAEIKYKNHQLSDAESCVKD